MRRRNRACEECHRLKIKCEGTSSGGVCERCSRNSLDCVPAAPRLQRNRINELEAQIQQLRNALQAHENTTLDWIPGHILDKDHHASAVLSFLDAHIPPSKQQDLLSFFSRQAEAAWPVIRLPMELDQIRAKSPILLLTVLVYFVTHDKQGTEHEVHDELVRETMHILGNEVIGRGQRSIQLVQAMLVATFWNKATLNGQQGSCYQIIQLATDMAIDIGIAGSSVQPSPAAYFCRYEDPTGLEARRTWLACFVALSASSISTRRPIALPWSSYHQECLSYLESRGDTSDILLCQIVHITQIIEEISRSLCLCQLAVFVDGNEYSTYTTITTLREKVDDWAARIPPRLALSQTLRVWRHVAMIHIYELALHTPTNKASFAAPFIPGRIAVKDFPVPVTIIPPLEVALQAIVQNCHAVIDTVAEMDPALILSLPSFCFAPTVLYALFVLVTTMVAATGPANTYGHCLTRDSFRIEHYGLKLRSLTAHVKTLDPTLSCYTTRFFDATTWLEQWYNDYTAILRRYETTVAC